jgi:antitoxin VapB
MALSIKTEEADRLARELSQLTGESMTDAVTVALRERLDRERVARAADPALGQRLREFRERIAKDYDRRPVTQEEWDQACGDDL